MGALFKAYPEAQPRRDDAEGVVYREHPRYRKLRLHALRAVYRFEMHSLARQAHVLRLETGILACRRIGQHRALRALEHERRALIVRIYAAHAALGENFLFCRGVFVHRPVQVEVILRKVREHRHVKHDPRHALKRQRMGRYLHYHMRAARVRHLAEELVQLVALRRRVLRVQELVAYHVAVSPYEADLRVKLRFEQVFHYVGRAGFSARAGEAYHLHFRRWVTEELAARHCKPEAAVGCLHIRRSVRRDILAQHHGRAILHRLGNIAVSVCLKALYRDEQIARTRKARVIADPAYLRVRCRIRAQYLYILYQLFQLHYPSSRLHTLYFFLEP